MSSVNPTVDGWVEMRVTSLTVDPFTNTPIVILQDREGRDALPIWIGLVEATAITTELEKIRLDRPMTHDLLATILGRCQVSVTRVQVRELRDNTFYAAIELEQFDASGTVRTFEVDARPSDAIAVALRTGARIQVARQVIDKARELDLRFDAEPVNLRRVVPSSSDSGERVGEAGDDCDPLHALPPDLLAGLAAGAFGKWKM
ncbi:MAG: bifunctional nuclease family protein [Myxococcales bacterium]|nr:bifunctional nuclease family protein [Myxococcales bacterium]